jgi:PAS domain S-box-containing protein
MALSKLTSSLRFRLIVLILLAILPMVGLTLYTNLEQRRAAARETQEEALRLAQLMALDQDQLIETTRQLLVALAHLPQIRSGDQAACQAIFADLLTHYPFYTALLVATPRGDVLCSAPPSGQPVNFADRTWYQRVLQTKEFVVSEYVIGRVSGRAALALAQPILDETGNLQSILVTGLDLDWINRWASEAQLPPGASFSVIDRNGTLLVRYPDAEGWVGRFAPEASIIQTVLAQHRGVTEAAGVDGVQRLYAFTPLSSQREADVGVYLYVGIPVEVAFAEPDQALARNLAWLGLVAGLAAIAAWLAADLFVLRQTRALLGATQRLAAGDLDARTGFAYRHGELGQLARAFDQMAETLKQRDVQRKQAEEVLRRYELLAAHSRDVILFMRRDDGRILEANAAATQVYGYSREELLALTIHDLRAPDIQALTAAHMAEADAHGILFETVNRRKDGSTFPVEVSSQGATIGGVRTLISVIRDITDRKRAEAEIQMLARFPDENPNPVLRVAQDGLLLYANEASADLLACWNCSVGGRLPDTWRRLILDTLDSGSPREEEAVCGERVVSLVLGPVVDGGYVNIYGRDITERKRAEVSLAEKAEELARSNKELEQFAYVASHDLQEPLRMVSSYVQLLAERYQGQLDEKAERYIAYAVDGANRMKRLIDDLLTYSRAGTQGKPLVPTDSQVVLEDVLGRLQVAIEEKQATVTHDPLPTVLADEVQLGQVFQNLIANALKFSNEAPPRIHVGAQRDAERGDRPSQGSPDASLPCLRHAGQGTGREWRFSVADNGIGLKPKYAERIFMIFQRLHGPTEYPGTGMGLAICKKIVERHGGRMWVESQPGQGATFYFTMPGV